ncbi:hypothetical protein [Methanosarcina sp. MSH10X1]|uniref:hypothetical protein n=1 Tax=Methanosarcina sp. MSH10X1 TaxID=2507075 RepID=UPI0013E385C2|nr:hypothetical protein [Methanosarcina sp. MSH10X1]
MKNESNYTVQKLYDYLYPTYGNSIIYNDSHGVWYTTRALGCDNSNFYISPETGVDELRMDTTGVKYLYSTVAGSNAGFIIDNVTFTGWNSTADAPMTNVYNKGMEIYKGHINNTIFQNVGSVKLYNIADQIINNITYVNCYGHLLVYNASNVTISNITVRDLYQPTHSSGYSFCLSNSTNCIARDVILHNTTKYGMDIQYCNYTEAYRLDIQKIDSYLAQNTGREGFSTVSCNHTTVHDIYIDNTGWSSLCPGGNYGYYYNCTVRNTGHNNLDCHNVFNSYFDNLTLVAAPTANYTNPANKNTNTMIFTAGYVTSPHTTNVTVKNTTCIDGPVAIDTGVDHLYFENINLTGENAVFSISADYCSLKNITMIGNSGNESKAKIQIWAGHSESAYNVSIIDTSFYRISAQQGTRNRFLNSRYTDATVNNHTNYYYLDIAVKDASGNPLDGIITAINTVSPSDIYSSTDGNAENKASFNIKSGRMYLPTQSRNDSGGIADIFYLGRATTNFNHNLSVSTSSGNVLLTGIDPDSSWYRPDPNIPTYTITAIIPDCSSNGPHIIGFAPSTENPFEPGEKKNFRIWTDGSLTGSKWTVDGVKVAEGTLNYTWTVNESVSTVEFSGLSTDGTVVNHVWNFQSNNHPRWDVNKDYAVNFTDINLIAQNYGIVKKAPYLDWDVNQNGTVDLDDLLITEDHFGERYNKN